MVVSNTGPLISAFQSGSFDLIVALFGTVHTSETCTAELVEHNWEDSLAQHGSHLISHRLTDVEAAQAMMLAKRIAAHPAAKNPDPSHHMGEAEVMI